MVFCENNKIVYLSLFRDLLSKKRGQGDRNVHKLMFFAGIIEKHRSIRHNNWVYLNSREKNVLIEP